MLIDKITQDDIAQKERNFWNNLLALDLWYWQGRLRIRLEKLKEDAEKEFIDYKYAATLNDEASVEVIATRLKCRKIHALKLLEPAFHFPIYQGALEQVFVKEKIDSYVYILEGDQLDRRTLKTVDRIRSEILKLHLAAYYDKKLIPPQKPSRFFFDERRAFTLLHQKTVSDVVGTANKLQYSPKPISKEAFDQCRKSAKPIERFQSFTAQCFASHHQSWDMLQKELAHVEKAMPGAFTSFFFGKTKRACLAWQSELYARQLETVEITATRFQELIENFYQWVSTLTLTESLTGQIFQNYMTVLEKEGTQLQQQVCHVNQLNATFFQELQEGVWVESRLRFQARLAPLNEKLGKIGEKLTRIKANQYGLTRQVPSVQILEPEGLRYEPTTPITSNLTTKALLTSLADGIPLSQANFDHLLLEVNHIHADVPGWQSYLEKYRAEIEAFKERLNNLLLSKIALTEMPYLRQGIQFFVKLGQDQILYALKRNIFALRAELLTDEKGINQAVLQEAQYWLEIIGATNCEHIDQLNVTRREICETIGLTEQMLQQRIQELIERSPAFRKLQPQLQLFVEASKSHCIKEFSKLKTEPLVLKDAQHQETFFNILMKLFSVLQILPAYIFEPMINLSIAHAKLRKTDCLKDILQTEMVNVPEKTLSTQNIQAIYDELYAPERTTYPTMMRI